MRGGGGGGGGTPGGGGGAMPGGGICIGGAAPPPPMRAAPAEPPKKWLGRVQSCGIGGHGLLRVCGVIGLIRGAAKGRREGGVIMGALGGGDRYAGSGSDVAPT